MLRGLKKPIPIGYAVASNDLRDRTRKASRDLTRLLYMPGNHKREEFCRTANSFIFPGRSFPPS